MELSYSRWNPSSEAASNRPETQLLFLHGMGGVGTLWRPIAASLEDRYSILAPDQRGHGKSQIPFIPGGRARPTYTPLDYGRDVIDTMEAADFHPAWLIGHSMGVRTACAAAHLRPDWVRGLILVDLGLSGAAGGGLGDGLAQFLKILPMEFPNRAEARQFMQDHCPDPSIAQYLLAVAVRTPTELHPDRVTFPFDSTALIQTIHAARDSSVRTWVDDLAQRGMPILILRGATSGVWSHEDYESEKAFFADRPTVRFLEIEGAGHGLPFEKRAEFIRLLTEFVES